MKLFLIAILVVAVLVISGCAQSPKSTENTPTSTSPTQTKATTPSPTTSIIPTVTKIPQTTPTQSPVKETNGPKSDKISTTTYFYESKSTSYLDFGYIDTEKITFTLTGYLVKDLQSPVDRYYFAGKLDWTFDSEKLIDDQCEIRAIHDSGTRDLSKEDTQVLVSGNYYIVQTAIKELEVKEDRKLKTGCENHKLVENPVYFGKRPLIYIISPPNATVSGKNVKGEDEKIMKTPRNDPDDMVNEITTRFNINLNLL